MPSPTADSRGFIQASSPRLPHRFSRQQCVQRSSPHPLPSITLRPHTNLYNVSSLPHFSPYPIPCHPIQSPAPPFTPSLPQFHRYTYLGHVLGPLRQFWAIRIHVLKTHFQGQVPPPAPNSILHFLNCFRQCALCVCPMHAQNEYTECAFG